MRVFFIVFLILNVFHIQAADSDVEAMIAAIKKGDLEAVKSMVDAGYEVDTKGRYEVTAFFMACTYGELEIVKYLHSKGANINQEETFYGAQPIDFALFDNKMDVVHYLLEIGADSRETVLAEAIRSENLDLAKRVVAAGPIYEKQLGSFDKSAAKMDKTWQTLIKSAKSRPNPPAPEYTASDLKRFAGDYEANSSDQKATVTNNGLKLMFKLDDAEAQELKVVGVNTFETKEKATIEFLGQGSILGFRLEEQGKPPVIFPSADAPIVPIDWSLHTQPKVSKNTVNWPSFRGANGDGVGDGKDTPVDIDPKEGKGLVWKTKVAGLGLSSPVIWDDQIILTTAVAEGAKQDIKVGRSGAVYHVVENFDHQWQVLSFDKNSGEQQWEVTIGSGIPKTARHFKASQANSSPATDGSHIVVVFPTAGLACLDMKGNVLWKKDLGGLNASYFIDSNVHWGYANSPIIYKDTVILVVDIYDGPYIAAWDLKTGEQKWRTERNVPPSWSTPSILQGKDGDELVVNAKTIVGYDPKTGKELWSMGPNSEIAIARPVVHDGVAYVTAGYPPARPIYAIRAGGRGEFNIESGTDYPNLAWSHSRGGAYMPSPVLYRGLLFVVHHDGRLAVVNAKDGAMVHRGRFSKRGAFTASPIVVNGKMYMGTEEGDFYITSTDEGFKELAAIEFDEGIMATPAVSEGVLYVRTLGSLFAFSK